MADKRLRAPVDQLSADQANRLIAVRVLVVVLLAGIFSVASVSETRLPVFALIMWVCAGINVLRCVFHPLALPPDRMTPVDVAAAYGLLALTAQMLTRLTAT